MKRRKIDIDDLPVYGISSLGGNAKDGGSLFMSPLKYDARAGSEISRLAKIELDATDHSLMVSEVTREDEEVRRVAGLT